jgi:hypothetical protein
LFESGVMVIQCRSVQLERVQGCCPEALCRGRCLPINGSGNARLRQRDGGTDAAVFQCRTCLSQQPSQRFVIEHLDPIRRPGEVPIGYGEVAAGEIDLDRRRMAFAATAARELPAGPFQQPFRAQPIQSFLSG